MPDMILMETEEKMDDTLKELSYEFSSIRTGVANASLLDHIQVYYYGAKTPVKQLAGISVVEGTQLYIKPYDKGILKDIEKAISTSDIGIAPQNDGNGLRIIIPKMTEERRRELAKEIGKKAEAIKVRIRNVRRDANDKLKKLDLAEDELKGYLDDVQALTDKNIKKIDEASAKKEKEVMTV